MNIIKQTPLMAQYHAIKKEHPDKLLFFQVGDFYELFFQDAKDAAAFLGITLTKRGKQNGEPIPLCGVPVHALDHYLQKLIKGGFCVAICDQLEPAQQGKVVKRGVTHVMTPGTLTDTRLLDAQSASYICSFFECDNKWGLLFTELLTSQLYATVIEKNDFTLLKSELNRFFPDEILVDGESKSFHNYFKKAGYFTSCVHTQDGFLTWAKEQFCQKSFEKVKEQQAVCKALDLLYHYIKKNNQAALETFATIHFYQPDQFMLMDASTQNNLELLKNLQDSTRNNTLLAALDTTVTPMGSRTLKKWFVRPLINKKMINHRLSAVDFFKNNYQLMDAARRMLQKIGDVERIVGRIALRKAQLHDYRAIMSLLEKVPEIKTLLEETNIPFLMMLAATLDPLPSLKNLLTSALNDDLEKNWIIKNNFDKNLDELRLTIENNQASIVALEKEQQEKTGINSLKIRYNSVFGYYVEITNTHKNAIPEDYKRKQTLTNRERFTFAQLQALENTLLHAHSTIEKVEQDIFNHVKQQVVPYLHQLRKIVQSLSQVDALLAFGWSAYQRGYTKPVFNDNRDIVIVGGKHPVVSQKIGSQFIENDTELVDEKSLWIITGPNMGGKSTYLRQVAQICIMAQCGSFVPAQSANLFVLDKLFTRIGASDNVAEGKSTFLVEMEETAYICQAATEKSLVILDEVGRGTSTFDGLAIAQSVVEYISIQIKARCLFATHYHELTELKTHSMGVVNYHAASKKVDDSIVFLHKIIPGITDGSFGLEVAKLAHMPEAVVKRAYQIEQELSSDSVKLKGSNPLISQQVNILKNQVQKLEQQLKYLNAIDFDTLSPKKAFDILWEFNN